MPGLEQDELLERLSFHGITESVCVHLRHHRDYILTLLPEVVDEFYGHMAGHPGVYALFKAKAQVAYARRRQLEHLSLLLHARFDGSYVESVRKVGRAHFHIGLEPHWYIGGYNFLLRTLTSRIAIEEYANDVVVTRDALSFIPVQQALTSAMMFDMDCALGVYLSAGLNTQE